MTDPDPRGPEFSGPYSAENNGVCSDGHPLNSFGRCEPMNVGTAEEATQSPDVKSE